MSSGNFPSFLNQSAVVSSPAENETLRGLLYGVRDPCDPGSFLHYDIGTIAFHALEALKIAILAIEQAVTGKRLIGSLEIGDFYRELARALEEENGAGIQSERADGSVFSIQDEIQGLIDLVNRAQIFAGDNLQDYLK